jgi:excisionase family DNA binding protein
MNNAPSGRLLTIKEAAAQLGFGRHRVARALRARQIAGVKIGARYVIPDTEIQRLLTGGKRI